MFCQSSEISPNLVTRMMISDSSITVTYSPVNEHLRNLKDKKSKNIHLSTFLCLGQLKSFQKLAITGLFFTLFVPFWYSWQ